MHAEVCIYCVLFFCNGQYAPVWRKTSEGTLLLLWFVTWAFSEHVLSKKSPSATGKTKRAQNKNFESKDEAYWLFSFFSKDMSLYQLQEFVFRCMSFCELIAVENRCLIQWQSWLSTEIVFSQSAADHQTSEIPEWRGDQYGQRVLWAAGNFCLLVLWLCQQVSLQVSKMWQLSFEVRQAWPCSTEATSILTLSVHVSTA